MRAVVVRSTGGPEVLGLERIERPRPSGAEVLVRVSACGVCALDVATRNGHYRQGVGLPLVPGHEICGVVAETGPEVDTLVVGDRVASSQRYRVCGHCQLCRSGFEALCPDRRFLGVRGFVGGYAEYVAIDEHTLARVPPGVSDEQAAIAACAIGTCLNAIRDVGRVRLGEQVLVTGAGGGLGVHAVQLARLAGARVIALTGAADKAPLLASLGAHEVVVASRGEDFAERVRALTDGRGADVIVDNVGTPIFSSTRRSLAPNGRWLLVGQVTGGFVDFNPAQLFLRNQSMLSVNSTSRAQLEQTLALIARGDVRPVIAGIEPLEAIGSVHRRLEAGGVAGRIVVRPGQAVS
ncbi:MAG: alcohol dehydrogenase catalytic domain-containing protein [Lautropia sp.]